MHTLQTLLDDLARLDLNPLGTLLVHSSYRSIGEVLGRADTVLTALETYMREGLLVLPTHTWSTVDANQPIYSVRDTPSCIGILPEIFRHRPGVFRSAHPTHSVAAKGKDAREFIAGDEYKNTPCAKDSAWGRLLDRNATILFIGVDLTKDTFIHGIEEWLDIPERLTDSQEQLISILEDGTSVAVPSHRHIGNVSDNFHRVEQKMREEGVLRYGVFGDAQVMLHECQPLHDILAPMLEADPQLFS
jgi:aminoglycoside 3-N-acetyltransferase